MQSVFYVKLTTLLNISALRVPPGIDRELLGRRPPVRVSLPVLHWQWGPGMDVGGGGNHHNHLLRLCSGEFLFSGTRQNLFAFFFKSLWEKLACRYITFSVLVNCNSRGSGHFSFLKAGENVILNIQAGMFVLPILGSVLHIWQICTTTQKMMRLKGPISYFLRLWSSHFCNSIIKIGNGCVDGCSFDSPWT